jgi:hypothetical protein
MGDLMRLFPVTRKFLFNHDGYLSRKFIDILCSIYSLDNARMLFSNSAARLHISKVDLNPQPTNVQDVSPILYCSEAFSLDTSDRLVRRALHGFGYKLYENPRGPGNFLAYDSMGVSNALNDGVLSIPSTPAESLRWKWECLGKGHGDKLSQALWSQMTSYQQRSVLRERALHSSAGEAGITFGYAYMGDVTSVRRCLGKDYSCEPHRYEKIATLPFSVARSLFGKVYDLVTDSRYDVAEIDSIISALVCDNCDPTVRDTINRLWSIDEHRSTGVQDHKAASPPP